MRPLTIVLLVAGIIFVTIGVIYLVDTAAHLPAFFPGHQAHDTEHHYKHGIAALVLGVAAFIGAWLTSAPERPADSS